MKISVVGTGYVGLVTGAVLASLGHEVTCADIDEEKIARLRQGISPIYEPGIEELIAEGVRKGKLRFTVDLAEATRGAEILFIAVGTPPAASGIPDISAVKAVARGIAPYIDDFLIVVNKSTVPVGCGDLVERILMDQGVPRERFEVVSNPEFLREGTAIHDTLHPDRIVVGTNSEPSAAKLLEVFAQLGAPTLITNRYTAELIKYASNSFLAMKISFINALSRVCELCGGDVDALAKGMGMDSRIGAQFLRSGIGWGGSCFPKDVQGLLHTSRALGYHFDMLNEVVRVNEEQTEHFVKRLETRLGGLKGKRLGLLGLAFKPNTDDIRDARSLAVIQETLLQGGEVCVYDPVAMDHVRKLYPQIEYAERPEQVAEGADALVLVTEWNEFKALDLRAMGEAMREKVLFDGRRFYGAERAQAAGFDYFTVGARSSLEQNPIWLETEPVA